MELIPEHLKVGPREASRRPFKTAANVAGVRFLAGLVAMGWNSVTGDSKANIAPDSLRVEAYASLNKNLGYKKLISIQSALAARGLYPTNKIDGEPGPATDAALAAFQSSVGLSPDGVYGSKTRNALFPAAKKVEVSKNESDDEILSLHDAGRAAKDVLTVAKGVRHAPENLIEKGIEIGIDLLDGDDTSDHNKRRHS